MVRGLFQDKQYFSALLTLAIPIVIQNFITSAMNIIDVAMIGQIGEVAVAGVGLSNQAFFILSLCLFGIATGSAIFTAQFWGKRDVKNIRKILGLCLTFAISAAVIFSVVAIFFPRFFLGIYSNDPQVIEVGSRYLRIVGFGYILTAISYSYGSILRSTGDVQLPMKVSVLAILFKTGLSYLLIFGIFGLPGLGVEGAAIGTVAARLLECVVLLFFTYKLKTTAAARLSEMDGFRSGYFSKYVKFAFPVMFNELGWSVGVSIYNIVYAHISTEAIAAMNIVSSIENLAFVLFIAISDATGILIGNRIGAGEEQTARDYGKRSLTLGIIGAMLIGLSIFLSADWILKIYNISDVAREYSRIVLTVSASVLWLRVSNLLIIVGVLRAGGDSRFAVILDLCTVWFVGVPMALIGGFVFKLPVYLIYLLIASEEAVKFSIGIRRFLSGKWVHNLVKDIHSLQPQPGMDSESV